MNFGVTSTQTNPRLPLTKGLHSLDARGVGASVKVRLPEWLRASRVSAVPSIYVSVISVVIRLIPEILIRETHGEQIANLPDVHPSALHVNVESGRF